MKQCRYDCVALCDFCIYFDYNGDDGVYVDKGYCRFHRRKTDPEDACGVFVCSVAELTEEEEKARKEKKY